MHRCDNADSKGSAVGAYDGSVSVYRDQLLGNYNATQLRHQEMNSLQEEVANVIRATGVALQSDTETIAQMVQLNTAIDAKDTIIANAASAALTAHYLPNFNTNPTVVATPASTYHQDPIGQLDLMRHGASGSRMCMLACNFYFGNYDPIKYFTITLPTAHRPFRFYLVDQPFVKVACVKIDGNTGIHTDIEGIYAKVHRSGTDGYLYIGNNQLAGSALPTATAFAAVGGQIVYNLSFTMNYRIYTGD
jgi:hypothetical protein